MGKLTTAEVCFSPPPAGFIDSQVPLRVLSLSTVFPNASEPGLGLFVEARLRSLAERVDLQVVAPLPMVDYSNPHRKWLRFGRNPGAGLPDPLRVSYPRWIYPPKGTPLNVLCLFAQLLPVFLLLQRRWRFDLIDAHFGYPEGVVAALMARVLAVPFAVTLRGSEIPFARYGLRRRLMKWALPQASLIVTVSEDLRRFAIEQGVSPDRVCKIPNGVDSSVFFPRPRAACRARLGITAHRKVILSAGELIAAKGHHHVIQALKELLDKGIDAEVVVAGGTARGGPPFEDEIRRMIHQLRLADRVRMLGWVPRETLAEAMCAADLFCLASHTEGWPNVVHEALSCGTPVVATRVGAVLEMIPADSLGLTVPVQDQPALEAALLQALKRHWDYEAIAAWGRSRGWDHVGDEVLTAFQHILPSSKRVRELR